MVTCTWRWETAATPTTSGASHIEPGGNAQNLATPLGKMLRIDPVDPALTPGSSDPISAQRPVSDSGDEPVRGAWRAAGRSIAYGFRNPYRFSFDAGNGDLIVADVGRTTSRRSTASSTAAISGWAVKEGTFPFNRTNGWTIGADIGPGVPAGADRPHLRHAGDARVRSQRRHLHHRRVRLPRYGESPSWSASTSSVIWRCEATRPRPTVASSTPT